jgi:hypothetical protein
MTQHENLCELMTRSAICHQDENEVIYFRFVSYIQEAHHLSVILFSNIFVPLLPRQVSKISCCFDSSLE